MVGRNRDYLSQITVTRYPDRRVPLLALAKSGGCKPRIDVTTMNSDRSLAQAATYISYSTVPMAVFFIVFGDYCALSKTKSIFVSRCYYIETFLHVMYLIKVLQIAMLLMHYFILGN